MGSISDRNWHKHEYARDEDGGKERILKACTKKSQIHRNIKDFGIDSNGIATISNSFDLRASLAITKTNEGDLIAIYIQQRDTRQNKFL